MPTDAYACRTPPGLGLEPDPDAIRRYLVDVEVRAKGQLLYRTPTI